MQERKIKFPINFKRRLNYVLSLSTLLSFLIPNFASAEVCDNGSCDHTGNYALSEDSTNDDDEAVDITGEFDIGSNIYTNNYTTNAGSVVIGSTGEYINNSDTNITSGNLTMNDATYSNDSGNLSVSGKIILNGSSDITNESGSIISVGTGIDMLNTSSIENNGYLSSGGSFLVDSLAVFTNNSDYSGTDVSLNNLFLTGGTINNTQGSIVVGGNYTQTSGSVVQDGTISVSGLTSISGGTFLFNNGSSTNFYGGAIISDMTVINEGDMEVGTGGAGNSFEISGSSSFTNNDDNLDIGNSSNSVDLLVLDSSSFINTGGADGTSFPWILDAGTKIEGNLTVGTAGYAGTGATFTNSSGYTRVTGDLIVRDTGTYTHTSGKTRIEGDITIESGGTYNGEFDEGYANNFTVNGIYNGNNSAIDISGDFSIGLDGIFNFSGSYIDADNFIISGEYNDGATPDIHLSGDMVINSDAIFNFDGYNINSSSLSLDMGATLNIGNLPNIATGAISFTGFNPGTAAVGISFGSINLNSNTSTITADNNNKINLNFSSLSLVDGGSMTFNSFGDGSQVTGDISITNGSLDVRDGIIYSGSVLARGDVRLIDVFSQAGFSMYSDTSLLTSLTFENTTSETKETDVTFSDGSNNLFTSDLNFEGGNFVFKEAVSIGDDTNAKILDISDGMVVTFHDVLTFSDVVGNTINVGSSNNPSTAIYLGNGASFDTIDIINNNNGGTVYVGTAPDDDTAYNLAAEIILGTEDLGSKINGNWVFGRENGSQRFVLNSELTLSGNTTYVTLNSDLTLSSSNIPQNLTLENGATLDVGEVAITGDVLEVKRAENYTDVNLNGIYDAGDIFDVADDLDGDLIWTDGGNLITSENTSLKFNSILGDVTNNGSMVISDIFQGGFIGTGTWYIEAGADGSPETGGVAQGRSPATGIEGTIDNEGRVYFIEPGESDLKLSNAGSFDNKGLTYIAGDLELNGGSYNNSGSNSETHILGNADIDNFSEGKWYFSSTFRNPDNPTDIYSEDGDEIHTISLGNNEEVLIGSEAELYLYDIDGDAEVSVLNLEQEILKNRGLIDLTGDINLGDGSVDTLFNNEKGLIYDDDGNYVGESFPVFHVTGNSNITEVNNKGGLILIDNTNTGTDTDNMLDQKTITNSEGGIIMIGFDGSNLVTDLKSGLVDSSLFEFDTFVGDANSDGDVDTLIGSKTYNQDPVIDLVLNENISQQIEITQGQFYLSGVLTLSDETNLIVGDADLDSSVSSYSGMFYKKDSFAYVGGLTVEEGSTLEINEDGFVFVDGEFNLNQNLIINGSLYLNDTINLADGNSITGEGSIYLGGVSSYLFSDKDEVVISLDVKADDGSSAVLNYLQNYDDSSDSDYTFYNNIDFKINNSITSIIVDTETGAPTNRRERYFENNSNIVVKDSGTLNLFIGDASSLTDTNGDISEETNISLAYSSDKDDIIYLTSANKDNDASLYIKNKSTLNAYGGTAVVGLGEVTIAGNLNVENDNDLYLGTLDNFNNNPTDDILYVNGEETDINSFDASSATNGSRTSIITGGVDRAPVVNLGEVEYTTVEGRSGYVVTDEAINVSSMSGISDAVLGMNVNGALTQVTGLNFQGISTSQDIVDILNQAFIDQGVSVTAVLTNDNKIKFSTEVGEGYYISLIDTVSGSAESLIKNESTDFGVFGRDAGDDNSKNTISGDGKWLVEVESGSNIEDGGSLRSEVEAVTNGSFGVNYNGIQYVVDDLNFSGNTNGSQVVNAIKTEMSTIVLEVSDYNYQNIVLPELNSISPSLDTDGNGTIDSTELAASDLDANSDGQITLDEVLDVQVIDDKLTFSSIIGVVNQDDFANLSLFDTSYTGSGTSLIKDPSVSLGSLGGEKTTDVEGKGDVDEEEEIAGILTTNSNLTSFAEVNMKYDSVILVGELQNQNAEKYIPTGAKDTYEGLMSGTISFAGGNLIDIDKDAYFANDLYNETTSTIINGVETGVKTVEKGGVRINSGGIFVSGNFHNYYKDESNGASTYKSSHLYIGDSGAEDAYGDAFLYVAQDFIQYGSDSELIVSSDGQIYIGGNMMVEDGAFLIESGGIVNLSGNLSFGSPNSQSFINNGEINFIGATPTNPATIIENIPNFDGDGTYNFTRASSISSSSLEQGYFNLKLANNGGENNGNLNFENANIDWTISGDSTSKTFTNNGSINVGDNSDITFDFVVDSTPTYNPVGFINLTTNDDSEFYVEKDSTVTIGKTTNYGEDNDENGILNGAEDINGDGIIDDVVGVGTFNVGTGNLTIRGTLISNGTYGTSSWGGTTTENSKNRVWINSGTMIVKNSVESRSNITIDQNGIMAIGYNWDGSNLTPLEYTSGIQLEVSNNNIVEEGSLNVAGNFINGIEGTYTASYFELGDGVDDSLPVIGTDSYLNVLGNFIQQSNASTFIIEEDGRMYVKEDLDLRYGNFTIKDEGELLVGGNIYVGTEANNLVKEYGSGDDAEIILTGETAKSTSNTDRIEVSGIDSFEGTWRFDSTEVINKTAHYEITNSSGDIELDGDITIGNSNSGDIFYDVVFNSQTGTVINDNNLTNNDKVEFSGVLTNNGTIDNTGIDALNKSEIVVTTLNNENIFNNNDFSILTISNNFNNNGTFTNFANAELNLYGSIYEEGTLVNNGIINMFGGSTSSSATEISGISSLENNWNIETGFVEVNEAIEVGVSSTLSISETATLTSNVEFAINGTLDMAGGNLILNGSVLGSNNFDLGNFGLISVGEEANVLFSSTTNTVNVVSDASGVVEHNLIFDTDGSSTLTSASGATINSNINITSGDTLDIVGGDTSITSDSTINISGSLNLNDNLNNSGDINISSNGNIDNSTATSTFYNEGRVVINYDETNHSTNGAINADTIVFEDNKASEASTVDGDAVAVHLNLDSSIISSRESDILVMNSNNAIDTTNLDISDNVTEAYYLVSLEENTADNTQLSYRVAVDTANMVDTVEMSANELTMGSFIQDLENNRGTTAPSAAMDDVINGVIFASDEKDLANRYDMLNLRVYNALETTAHNNSSIFRDAILSNSDIYSTINVPMSFLAKDKSYQKSGLYNFGNPWFTAIANEYDSELDSETAGYDADYNTSTTGAVIGYDFTTYGRKGRNFKVSKYGIAGTVLQNESKETFSYNNSESYNIENSSLGFSGYYTYLTPKTSLKLMGSYMTHSGSYERAVAIDNRIEQAEGDTSGTTSQIYLEAGLPFSNINPFLFADIRSTTFEGFTETSKTGAELQVEDVKYDDTIVGAGLSIFESFQGNGSFYDKLNLTFGIKYGMNTNDEANVYDVRFMEDNTNQDLSLNGNARVGDVVNTYLSADIIKDNLNYKLQYQMDEDDLGSGSSLMLKVMILN